MRLASQTQAHPGPASGAAGVAAVSVAAVSTAEFSAAMAALGPFESRPHLAVAVSGGRDSLALALLARDWTRERDGSLTALIVDHRLRAESTTEAHHVATLLGGQGIAAQILTWTDAKPETGISEAARLARHDLLQRRCRALGILHLLLGHQADDQAETVLMRLADGSGPEGLAGMAAVVEQRDIRLLRPLLGVARERLGATVRAAGLRWVDDPSNERSDYARTRLRQSLAGVSRRPLDEIARSSAMTRQAVERRLAMLMVALVDADPRGFAWLNADGLLSLPETIGRRLLSRLAAAYGGRHYPARKSALNRALGALREGSNAVAGGCRFVRRGRRLLVCRETGAIAPGTPFSSPFMLWDRRYVLATPTIDPGGGVISALGPEGRSQALANNAVALRDLPAPVAEALPALWRAGRLAAVFLPQTAANLPGGDGGRGALRPATVIPCLDAVFQPPQGLVHPAWPLVLPADAPIYLD